VGLRRGEGGEAVDRVASHGGVGGGAVGGYRWLRHSSAAAAAGRAGLVLGRRGEDPQGEEYADEEL